MKVAIKVGKTCGGRGREIKKTIGYLLKEQGMELTADNQEADLAVIIGGDGTFLAWQSKFKCPLFGIKSSDRGVGYYAGASAVDYLAKIGEILNGNKIKNYRIILLARISAESGGRVFPLALNEYLISSGYVRKMFNCKLTIGGETSIERNSGVIVYTPTGSNAFARSAGAKKMKNNDAKIGVIAIAPYQGRLKSGGIILDGGEVKIECLNESGEICADGQKENSYKIKSGDSVTIRKSEKPLQIIEFAPGFAKNHNRK